MRAEFPSLRRLTSARRRASRLAAPVSAQAANGESLEDRTLLSETPLTLVVSDASGGGEDSFVQFEVSQASGQAASEAFSQFLARLEAGNVAKVLTFDDVSATLQFDNAPTLNVSGIHTGDVFVLGSATSLKFDYSTDRVIAFGNDLLLPDEDLIPGPVGGDDAPGDRPEDSLADSALPIPTSVTPGETATGEASLAANPAGLAPLPRFGELPGPLPREASASEEANELPSLARVSTSASVPLSEDFSEFGQSVLETSTDLAAAETDAATRPILTSANSTPGSLDAIDIAPEVESPAAQNYEAAFVPATMTQLASPVTTVLAGLVAAADTVARVVLVALGADGGDGPAASIIDPAAPALDAAAVAGGEAPKWALGKSVDDLLDFSRVTITGGEAEAGLLESAPVTIPPAGQNGVLAVQVETLPQHGELQEIAGRLGQYRYTADPGFSGVDTFSYIVVTPGGSSSRGLVTVVVPEAAASPRISLQADINLNHPQAHDFVVELAQSARTNTSSETAIDESFRQVDLWADEL